MIYGRKYTAPVYDESLLDFFPNAKIAFSVRRLRSDYSGKCLRVRRISDNVEKDIDFDENNLLDSNDIASFCGLSNGVVTVWYSQASGTSNAIQETESRQPIIFEGGSVVMDGTNPAIRFNGSQFLVIGNSDPLNPENVDLNTYVECFFVNSSQQGSEFIFEHGNNVNNGQGFYVYGSAYNAWIVRRYSGINPDYHADGSFYWASPSNARILASFTYNGNGSIYKNGNLQPQTNIYGQSVPNLNFKGLFRIMSSTNASYFSIGKVQEVVIYNKSDFSDRSNIESNINSYFGIY